jgi:predicted metal-dependent hydrolase
MELIEVRHSRRARHWRLVVPWGEPALLTVPEGTTSLQIERVLRERHEWIARQRERQRPRLGLDRRAVSESDSRIRARELVSEVAEREAASLAVTYKRIRIGSQRTLWGSCSPIGTLSFNWKLVLAPFDVLDYVVVHELCHLRVRNHSRRFWSMVEQRRPQWRQQRDWLRDHGAELLAFRASA